MGALLLPLRSLVALMPLDISIAVFNSGFSQASMDMSSHKEMIRERLTSALVAMSLHNAIHPAFKSVGHPSVFHCLKLNLAMPGTLLCVCTS